MAGHVKLIHPIYLDVPMLVSFAAAVEGGVAFSKRVTTETESSTASHAQATATFGFSALFSRIFDASVSAQGATETGGEEKSQETQARGHTEASVAILLYDQLSGPEGSIVRPTEHDQMAELEPGSLVELTGTVVKNAVDTVIDYIDAIDILVNLGDQGKEVAASPKPGKAASQSGKKKEGKSPLSEMRETLDRDRRRTPISNVLLRCTQPSHCTAVLTLRTENLRDLTLSELHKNTVRVVGKVTRVIAAGESMSAFENYGMSLLTKETLAGAFESISNTEGMRTEFSEVEVDGPAVQVLPLMVFV